jgi:hypothetical protein
MKDIKVFATNIPPFELRDLLINSVELKDALLYKESHYVDETRQLSILVFEKYFHRIESTASLTIILENINEINLVKSIPSGSADGRLLGFDLGAAKNFVKQVETVIEDHIVAKE